jgi:hypothetical protein
LTAVCHDDDRAWAEAARSFKTDLNGYCSPDFAARPDALTPMLRRIRISLSSLRGTPHDELGIVRGDSAGAK